MDLSSHRENFPVLCEENPVAYLDNACVTLRPQSVIDAISDYYTKTPGCGGRSVHRYGTAVSKTISRSRKTLQGFFNAPSVNEIVFTRNATHSLNQVAKGLSWQKDDIVLTTDREHNSNLVPWLQLEEEHGVDHRVVPSNPDNTFDLEAFETACAEAGEKLRMVSVSHVGNLDGIETPIQEITKITRDYDALICVDGAQSAPHMPVDVQKLDIDFFLFRFTKCSDHLAWEGYGARKSYSIRCGPSNRADRPSRPHTTTGWNGQIHPQNLRVGSVILQE